MDDHNYLDIESNSTPQTVYSSHNVKLQHKRVADTCELPRRIANVAEQRHSPTAIIRQNQLRDYLLQKCNSTDEITESKQMLFDKHMDHINDDNAHRVKSKQRFNVCHDQSDDCISSTYPNSSRSTARDLTCSSISSTMARSMSFVCDPHRDDTANMWTDIDNEMSQHAHLLDRQQDDRAQRSINPNANKTYPTTSTIAYAAYPLASMKTGANRFMPRNHFDIAAKFQRGKSVESSEPLGRDMVDATDSLIPGYTREHLLRAEKFGSVIKVCRMPGHHVGPTKNPDCMCTHCRRWFDERRHLRERALSMDFITSIGQLTSNPIDYRSRVRFNTNIV